MSSKWRCRSCFARNLRRALKTSKRFQTTSTSGASTTVAQTVYPALIERARKIAVQHGQLSKSLLEGFDSATSKKVGELGIIVEALEEWDKASESLSELQKLVRSSDAELRELAQDDLEPTVQQLNAASHSLTTSLIPKHPFADLPCLIEIRPGAGGSEAAIFTGDLLRMYQAYCANRGLRTELVKLEADEGKGEITEAILEVLSSGAYGVLRCEAGVHRVQRVPATETKGRTHTSSAAVMVLPSLPSTGGDESSGIDLDDPNSDYYIDPKDVRIEVMRAQGAGGQHVNKTESAVRLTHVPTSTVAFSQDSRSQQKNREKAWSLLRARIAQSRRETREEEMLKMRRGVVGVGKIGRGDKIRTYNWGQQRITDHRSGMTVHGIEGVMAGGNNLEDIMASVRAWLTEREVEALVAEEEHTGERMATKRT